MTKTVRDTCVCCGEPVTKPDDIPAEQYLAVCQGCLDDAEPEEEDQS
jgi:hypothetical protein